MPELERTGWTGLTAVGVPVSVAASGPRPAVEGRPAGDQPEALLPTGLDQEWCARHRFTAAVGQTAVLPAATADPGVDLVVVGVGPDSALEGDAGAETLRRAAAAFVRSAGTGVAAFVLPDGGGVPPDVAASAVAEGGSLAAYRYLRYRTTGADATEGPDTLVVVDPASEQRGPVGEGAARGARIAESVAFARDLVNEPPTSLNPGVLADSIVDRFAGVDTVHVEVWDEDRIVAERLGGLLGVARGSSRPPRLVRMEYRPDDPVEVDGHVPHLALVGKGITFDSGGLSLKSASGMETMKTDMAGAAAVAGAIDAASALGARLPITAFAPLTENMPGGSATKPGDVLTTRNGKTIEVLNTDAEGRLVLADGLSLASELAPDAIVDLATLTGAAVVALGKEVAARLGNDERLGRLVGEAGARAGEHSWPLPMPDDYRGHIDSEIADMRNTGRAGQAGAIVAALLLREFVGGVPWVHLDIAGPARAEDSSRYMVKGGTGFGVRTLTALVTSDEAVRALATLGR